MLALLAAGCGDNLNPNMTWADSESVWADSWCQYAERCFPEAYTEYFPTDVECFNYVFDLNCENINCDSPYSNDRWLVLRQCEEDMTMTDCGATVAPYTCGEAFASPPYGVPTPHGYVSIDMNNSTSINARTE